MVVLSLENEKFFWKVGLIGLIIGLMICFALFFPITFILDSETFTIRRLFSKRIILINQIEKISLADDSMFSFYSPSGINAFNSKGFFGYLGKTADENTSYATSVKSNIWIKLKTGEKILVSIKNKEDFIDTFTFRI